MEIDRRFWRIQLFVKAAEQFRKLKSKQMTGECSHSRRNNNSINLFYKWSSKPKEIISSAANHSAKEKTEKNSQLSERDCPEKSNNKMTMLQVLAFNALDLTVPASDVLLRNRRSSWVQLSGHPGSFTPAGPGTIWKKYQPGNNNNNNDEKQVYEELMKDVAAAIVPKFCREASHGGEKFIEMQDLLHEFTDPNVMDIKLGTRTFLESEVCNTTARRDLYDKMVKIDPSAPTREEHEIKAVTKLRYMTFREHQSSSCSLGFRIEAVKFQGSPPTTDVKMIRDRDDVKSTLELFLSRNALAKDQLLQRLHYIRKILEISPFFQKHEVVGSSILIVYDHSRVGAWIIDFAKTVALPQGISITHRSPWILGNHEEGYLTGIDNLIQITEEL